MGCRCLDSCFYVALSGTSCCPLCPRTLAVPRLVPPRQPGRAGPAWPLCQRTPLLAAGRPPFPATTWRSDRAGAVRSAAPRTDESRHRRTHDHVRGFIDAHGLVGDRLLHRDRFRISDLYGNLADRLRTRLRVPLLQPPPPMGVRLV